MLGLAVKRPRLPRFWRFPDAKHWACWHFGISKSSVHTLIWNSSFCQPFRQGSKLVNWGKSTLGWAEHLWNGAKTWKWEISHRAATKSACVSDHANYFILVKKCGPESQSTQAILKQIGHKSYIHLEFHFCTFLRPPRSYISELATAVFIYIGPVFVLPNHSRVFHSKNRCAQICRNHASRTVAVQLMTSSREELVP